MPAKWSTVRHGLTVCYSVAVFCTAGCTPPAPPEPAPIRTAAPKATPTPALTPPPVPTVTPVPTGTPAPTPTPRGFSGVYFGRVLSGGICPESAEGSATPCTPAGEPLVGAVVSLTGMPGFGCDPVPGGPPCPPPSPNIGFHAERTTDAEGRFLFRDLPPGPYQCRVTCPGYEVVEARQVTIGAAPVEEEIPLAYTRTYRSRSRLQGFVETYSADAAATFRELIMKYNRQGFTDAEAAGQLRSVSFASDAARSRSIVRLGGARVTISADRAVKYETITDSYGNFLFDPLPVGVFTITVTKAGYVPYRYRFTHDLPLSSFTSAFVVPVLSEEAPPTGTAAPQLRPGGTVDDPFVR
jgi:hypothetical protein